MTYTVLARKYRPQTFADLSGQEHVTRTLGNAIASGRVAHAFLFTGVRGVGKTTTARILAKALNCATGPTSAPCGTCDACREITAGNDLDVLEIDGASNNGVDDVRRLQETIPFRPARDRFKIVIVDEVHMLSIGAFNAFLKTLEEPPPHVKFIFATTESHKVPITIRSRCQRYDFRLIPQATVADRVRQILAAEGIAADEHAISVVSREAAGSMRDALTLLDQVVAFSGGALVGDEVARVLGIADREVLHTAVAAILDGDGARALEQVDLLAQRGLDLLHFSRALVELFRDLVVLRVSGAGTDLVALVEEERERALALAKRVEPLEVQRAFHAASLLVEDIARSPLPRMTLEMGLVRLASRPALRPVSELVARLESLEASLGQRGAAVARGPAPRASGREQSSRAASPRRPSADEPEPDPEWRAVEPDEREVSAVGTIEAPRRSEPPRGADLGSGTAIPLPPAGGARGGSATPAGTGIGTEIPLPLAGGVRGGSATPAGTGIGTEIPLPLAGGARGGSVAPPGTVAGAGAAIDAAALVAWESMVGVLVETKPALGALLKHALPRRLDGEMILLAFPPGSFYGKQAESAEARASIAAVAERRFGAHPKVAIVYEPASADGSVTLAQIESERESARLAATRKKALNHPVVLEALRVFETSPGAVEVRLDVDETG